MVTNTGQGGVDKVETDIYKTAWTDYSNTSTIVGFDSYANKYIKYKEIGKTCFVKFWIEAGTSAAQSNAVYFTLPTTSANDFQTDFRILAGSGSVYGIGRGLLAANNSTVNLYPGVAGGSWAGSGTGGRFVGGEFWFETL